MGVYFKDSLAHQDRWKSFFGHLLDSFSLLDSFFGWWLEPVSHPLWLHMAHHGHPWFPSGLFYISSHCYLWHSLWGLTHFLRAHPLQVYDPSSSAPCSVRVSVQTDPTEFSAMIIKRFCLLLLRFCTCEKPLTFFCKEHFLYFLSCSPSISQKVSSPDHLLLLFRSSVPTAVFKKSTH